MVVFGVVREPLADFHLFGIFSTREKAQAWIDENVTADTPGKQRIRIAEWVLDVPLGRPETARRSPWTDVLDDPVMDVYDTLDPPTFD